LELLQLHRLSAYSENQSLTTCDLAISVTPKNLEIPALWELHVDGNHGVTIRTAI